MFGSASQRRVKNNRNLETVVSEALVFCTILTSLATLVFPVSFHSAGIELLLAPSEMYDLLVQVQLLTSGLRNPMIS